MWYFNRCSEFPCLWPILRRGEFVDLFNYRGPIIVSDEQDKKVPYTDLIMAVWKPVVEIWNVQHVTSTKWIKNKRLSFASNSWFWCMAAQLSGHSFQDCYGNGGKEILEIIHWAHDGSFCLGCYMLRDTQQGRACLPHKKRVMSWVKISYISCSGAEEHKELGYKVMKSWCKKLWQKASSSHFWKFQGTGIKLLE